MFYDIYGNTTSAYDIYGNTVGDYSKYDSEYQHKIIEARNEWMNEKRSGDNVVSQIIHTDQHERLRADNTLFPYLSKVTPWVDTSACIGLGDVGNYSVNTYKAMQTCLDDIPSNKQINIWGNHDTWVSSSGGTRTPNDSEWTILNTYFNNSAYPSNYKYNTYGIESFVDSVNHIKYCVLGGWEYDSTLGGYSHYVIGSDSMDAIINMLSNIDGNDIVILSHVQPFKTNAHSDWTFPYEDANGAGAITSDGKAIAGAVVNQSETSLDQMLIDRKMKRSGTVKDSYGNSHSYNFTGCTGDLICCYAGHEHQNMYMHQNSNIPVVLYDAYSYDTHPFCFVNINRTQRHISVWRVDETPQIVKWVIPFEA